MRTLFPLVVFSVGFTSCLFSQKIVRSTIGTLGSSKNHHGIVLQQSAGQPALTSNEKLENGTGLRQGFIQPIWFETQTNELNVELFPNPNQGEFSFLLSQQDAQSFNYEILDQHGKCVLQKSGTSNQLLGVSIPNPARGMYHLNVFQADKKSSFKINVIY